MSSHDLFPRLYATDTVEALLNGLPDDLRTHAMALQSAIAGDYKQRREALPNFSTLTPSQAATFAPAAKLLKGLSGELQERIGQYVAAELHDKQAREEHDVIAHIAEAVGIAGKRRLRWTESDIREAADILAKRCGSPAWNDEQMVRVAQHWFGIPFTVPGKTAKSQRARLETAKWWRRTIRRTAMRSAEKAHLRAGMVGKGRMRYASNHAVKVREGNLARQDAWLKSTTAERVDKDSGEIFRIPLPSREETTNAKLAEFWAWCAGVQALAEADSLEMAMLTLTLEPIFHPSPAMGKSSWNGTTPDLANKEIGRRWAQIRAALGKRGITLSGFRASEPHGDGCPHWHLFLMYRPNVRTTVLAETLKLFPGKIAMRVRDSKGLDHRRIFDNPADAYSGYGRKPTGNEGSQAELAIINTAQASVASYVTKYVMKQTKDDRAGAWRSTWGVRGLQWFGIRSALTKWRELRRLPKAPTGVLILQLWTAATNNNAADFLTLLGGLSAVGGKAVKTLPLTVPTRTAYGEDDEKLVGYMVAGETVITRLHEWKLVTQRPSDLAPTVTVKPIYPREEPKKAGMKTLALEFGDKDAEQDSALASECVNLAAKHTSLAAKDLGSMATWRQESVSCPDYVH